MATRGARLGLGLGLVYHTEHGDEGREAALGHAEAEENGACAQQHLGGCRVRVRVRKGFGLGRDNRSRTGLGRVRARLALCGQGLEEEVHAP